MWTTVNGLDVPVFSRGAIAGLAASMVAFSSNGSEGRSPTLIDIRTIRGLELVRWSVAVLVGDGGGGKFGRR